MSLARVAVRHALAPLGLLAAGWAVASALPLEPRPGPRATSPLPTLPAAEAPCALSLEATELASAIMTHPLQQRAHLRCSGVLAAVAAQKAAEMAREGRVTHTLGVVPPNRRLRKAGYRLPPSYPGMDANQVEAVAGGFPSAQAALQALLDSPAHRAHLLAEHDFYAEQDEIGVGFARNRDTEYVEYWVVYIARRADGGNPPGGLHATVAPGKGAD